MSEGTPVTVRPTKSYVLEKLLGSGGSVFVAFDPRVAGVRVPKSLRDRPQAVFQLGLNMPNPIRDLSITDAGWSAVLSFNDGFKACNVPWSAVFAIGDGDKLGTVWKEDMPSDHPAVPTEDAQLAAATVRKTLPPGWRVVDGGKKDEDSTDESA